MSKKTMPHCQTTSLSISFYKRHIPAPTTNPAICLELAMRLRTHVNRITTVETSASDVETAAELQALRRDKRLLLQVLAWTEHEPEGPLSVYELSLRDAYRWRTAIVEALIVNHIYKKEHEIQDPRTVLSELIAYEIDIALDTSVSAAAQAIYERGRQAGIKENSDTVKL